MHYNRITVYIMTDMIQHRVHELTLAQSYDTLWVHEPEQNTYETSFDFRTMMPWVHNRWEKPERPKRIMRPITYLRR